MVCGCDGLPLCPRSGGVNKKSRNGSFWEKVSSGKEKTVVFALQCFRISSRYREMPMCCFQMLPIKVPFFFFKFSFFLAIHTARGILVGPPGIEPRWVLGSESAESKAVV